MINYLKLVGRSGVIRTYVKNRRQILYYILML